MAYSRQPTPNPARDDEREALDPRYRKRTDASRFFKEGRVFALLWHDGTARDMSQARVLGLKFFEKVHYQIRRLAVVKTGHGYSWCVSIHTYKGKGVAMPGMSQENAAMHAIVYASGSQPLRLREEINLRMEPIEIKLADGQRLDPMSRLNLGRIYTVEWNVKVMNVGLVEPISLARLLADWKTISEKGDTRAPLLAPHSEIVQAIRSQQSGDDRERDPSIPNQQAHTGSLEHAAATSSTGMQTHVQHDSDRAGLPSVSEQAEHLNQSGGLEVGSLSAGSLTGETIIEDDLVLPKGVGAVDQGKLQSLLFPAQDITKIYNLQTLRQHLTADLNASGSEVVRLLIHIEWEVIQFIRRYFQNELCLGSVMVLSGNIERCRALTVEEHLRERHSTNGTGLLELLQKASEQLQAQPENAGMSLCLQRAAFETTHLNISWKVPGEDRLPEIASVWADGPPTALADLLLGLAWITAAFRSTYFDVPDQPSFWASDVTVRMSHEQLSHDFTCSIQMDSLLAISMPREHLPCWMQLYRSCVIVNDFGPEQNLQPRNHLRVELQPMMYLASADDIVERDGALLILGLNNALVPVEKLPDGSFKWHLMRIPNTCREIDNMDWSLHLKVEDLDGLLRAPLHYLGFWESCKITLATEQGTYKKILQSNTKEKKSFREASGGSAGLSAGIKGITGQVSRNWTYVKTQISRDDEIELPEFLTAYRQEPIILYDPSQKVAWLPQTLSVVLHAAHLRAKWCYPHNVEKVPFSLLASKGGVAAFNAINGKLDTIIHSVGQKEEDQISLRKLIYGICRRIKTMKIQPQAKRVRGYELAELVNPIADITLRQSKHGWNPEHGGWKFVSEQVVTIICRRLGDVILPGTVSTANEELATIPTGHDFLAAPIFSLMWIAEKQGLGTRRFASGFLSETQSVGSVHAAFGHCALPHGPTGCCLRVQQIEKYRESNVSTRLKAMAEHVDGVILIGRAVDQRIYHGQRSVTVAPVPESHQDSDSDSEELDVHSTETFPSATVRHSGMQAEGQVPDMSTRNGQPPLRASMSRSVPQTTAELDLESAKPVTISTPTVAEPNRGQHSHPIPSDGQNPTSNDLHSRIGDDLSSNNLAGTVGDPDNTGLLKSVAKPSASPKGQNMPGAHSPLSVMAEDSQMHKIIRRSIATEFSLRLPVLILGLIIAFVAGLFI